MRQKKKERKKSKPGSHRPVRTGHHLDSFSTVLLCLRGRKAHSAAALCDRGACGAKEKRSPFSIHFPYFIFSPSTLGTQGLGGLCTALDTQQGNTTSLIYSFTLVLALWTDFLLFFNPLGLNGYLQLIATRLPIGSIRFFHSQWCCCFSQRRRFTSEAAVRRGAPGCRDRCDGFTGAMGFQPNYR